MRSDARDFDNRSPEEMYRRYEAETEALKRRIRQLEMDNAELTAALEKAVELSIRIEEQCERGIRLIAGITEAS